MTAVAPAAGRRPPIHWRRWIGVSIPYLLLAPGLIWLFVFFIYPSIEMLRISLSSGSLDTGYSLTFSTHAYVTALQKFPHQFGNSILYSALATTFTFLIGFPVAYTCLLYTSPSPRDRTRSRMP